LREKSPEPGFALHLILGWVDPDGLRQGQGDRGFAAKALRVLGVNGVQDLMAAAITPAARL
jgi:hypothetical protein